MRTRLDNIEDAIIYLAGAVIVKATLEESIYQGVHERLYPPKANEFLECDACRAKAGSPTLCKGCLHNRTLIEKLSHDPL